MEVPCRTGAHLTLLKDFSFYKKIYQFWVFPQNNANLYNVLSKVCGRFLISLFFSPLLLLSCLPALLGRVYNFLSVLWKGPFLGANVAWNSGLKFWTLMCVNHDPQRDLLHSGCCIGHWVQLLLTTLTLNVLFISSIWGFSFLNLSSAMNFKKLIWVYYLIYVGWEASKTSVVYNIALTYV